VTTNDYDCKFGWITNERDTLQQLTTFTDNTSRWLIIMGETIQWVSQSECRVLFIDSVMWFNTSYPPPSLLACGPFAAPCFL